MKKCLMDQIIEFSNERSWGYSLHEVHHYLYFENIFRRATKPPRSYVPITFLISHFPLPQSPPSCLSPTSISRNCHDNIAARRIRGSKSALLRETGSNRVLTCPSQIFLKLEEESERRALEAEEAALPPNIPDPAVATPTQRTAMRRQKNRGSISISRFGHVRA
jgi:hypothetical protein